MQHQCYVKANADTRSFNCQGKNLTGPAHFGLAMSNWITISFNHCNMGQLLTDSHTLTVPVLEVAPLVVCHQLGYRTHR